MLLRLRYSLKLKMMMMKHFNNRYIDDELLTTMITNTRKKNVIRECRQLTLGLRYVQFRMTYRIPKPIIQFQRRRNVYGCLLLYFTENTQITEISIQDDFYKFSSMLSYNKHEIRHTF